MRTDRDLGTATDLTIPVIVECGTPVTAGLGADRIRSIGHALTSELGALVPRLGLAGEPAIEIQSVSSNRAVRVRVHGNLQPYSPYLMTRVWRALAPIGLRDLPETAEATHQYGFPDGWFTGYLTGSTLAGQEPMWDLVSDFLVRLVYEIIQERPACLAGSAQVSAYLMDGPANLSTSVQPNSTEALSTLLKSVLDMGVSVRDTPLVLQEFGVGQEVGRSVEDVVEGVFARLRSDRIEIHIEADTLRSFTLEQKVDAPVSVYGEQFDPSLHDLFHTLEQDLYSKTGIQLPDLVWVPSHEVARGMLAVKINERTFPQTAGLFPVERSVDAPVESSAAPEISGQPTASPADIVFVVGSEIAREVERLLDVGYVEHQLAQLQEAFPELVRAATEQYSVGDLTRVLRGLVRENLSIRDMRTILERMLQYDTISIDSSKYVVLDDRLASKQGTPPELVRGWESYREFVRSGLKYYMSYAYAQQPDTLYAYLLDQQLETYLDAVAARGRSSSVRARLAEGEQETLRDAVWAEVGEVMATSARPVILAAGGTRATLRELIAPELPDLPVMAYSELAPGLDVEPIGSIGLE